MNLELVRKMLIYLLILASISFLGDLLLPHRMRDFVEAALGLIVVGVLGIFGPRVTMPQNDGLKKEHQDHPKKEHHSGI
jgi:hypothetical protein